MLVRLLKSSSIRGGEPEILTRLFRQEKHAPDSITMPPDRTVLSGGRHLRHELKYIINEGTYQYLRSRLLSLMSPDGHSRDGGYRVTSLYFDDVYNSGYWQKLNGAEVRRKFRIRAYDLDPSFVSLESKHKDLSYVSKLSRKLTDEQYRALLLGDCSFMAEQDGEEDVAWGYRLLEAGGRKRGFLISGGEVDTERMAKILLDEFRGGKLGRFTLELPD